MTRLCETIQIQTWEIIERAGEQASSPLPRRYDLLDVTPERFSQESNLESHGTAMKLGRVLEDLRTRKGWTQRDLAEAAGISDAYVSQIETGKRNPTGTIVGRLADALGTSVPAIVLLSVDEDDVPPDKRDAFRVLAPAFRAIFDASPLVSMES